MSIELENWSSRTQRTRRNIMAMGAIFASVTVAKVSQAAAGNQGNQGNEDNQGDQGNRRGGVCFLKGTRIRTADGERKIETLAIGDLLPTIFGGLRPIRWIGRYPIRKSDPSKPWVRDALPIRIARSALAPDVPHADLYVSGAHALLIDGLLVPAGLLTNGTTITRFEAREYDELEFFHLKLESHDVVYAEGAPAETLLDVKESDFADYVRLYGTPATGEARCAPLVDVWGGRNELKSRFRSALSPWIDLRNQGDVIRDRLEERGILLSRQAELAR